MIGIISHPDCLLHEMGYSHPEQPDRLRAIDTGLIRSGLDERLRYYQAPLATQEELLRVHDADYVQHIFRVAPQEGFVALDEDTVMNPCTLNAALRAAGANILAVDLVMKKEIQAAFCNVRPPGHHAEKRRAMGFCFFNNIAVGVAHALEFHKLKRVAIIDFDVHHGNGTEDIFYDDQRVLFCSSFQHPFYPGIDDKPRPEHILHLPLRAGTLGKEYREFVSQHWLQAIEDFKPEMIFFSAGFDAHESDQLANLNFHAEDYGWITREIRLIAEKVCEGRIVSTLEGGYSLQVLGGCAAAHVAALKG